MASEPFRTLNWSSRRSASLPRRTDFRQRHNYTDLSPYRSVFPAVPSLPSSLRSYTPSTRWVSPKPSTVDAKLRDAQKLGNHYHITLNLNALLNHPIKATSEEAATSADYMMLRSSSSSMSGCGLTTQMRAKTMNGGRRSSVARMPTGGNEEEVNDHRHQLQLPQVTTGRRSRLTDDDEGYVIIQSVRASSSSSSVTRPQSVQHQDEGFVIRSVTPCSVGVVAQRQPKEDDKVEFDLQLIGFDPSSSTKQQTSYIVQERKAQGTSQRKTLNDDDAEEPLYTMTIDETMTMDYYQPDKRTAAAVDRRRSVAKQAKSNMPLPLPSPSKDHAMDDDEKETRRIVVQPAGPSAPASAGAAAAHKSARGATHRKRPIPAKKDTAEELAMEALQKTGRPPSDAHGSIIIDRSSNAEHWKRMRSVEDGSNEGFRAAEETLQAQNCPRRRLSPDLLGQGLMSTSSQRSNAAFDEPDRVSALVHSEVLTQTVREEATGTIEEGSDEGFYTEIKVSRGKRQHNISDNSIVTLQLVI